MRWTHLHVWGCSKRLLLTEHLMEMYVWFFSKPLCMPLHVEYSSPLSSPSQKMCLLWRRATLTVETAFPPTAQITSGSEDPIMSDNFTQLFSSWCGTTAPWTRARRETTSMPRWKSSTRTWPMLRYEVWTVRVWKIFCIKNWPVCIHLPNLYAGGKPNRPDSNQPEIDARLCLPPTLHKWDRQAPGQALLAQLCQPARHPACVYLLPVGEGFLRQAPTT